MLVEIIIGIHGLWLCAAVLLYARFVHRPSVRTSSCRYRPGLPSSSAATLAHAIA